jgi:16S rRNA (guanine527-N7)-methyltransferase
MLEHRLAEGLTGLGLSLPPAAQTQLIEYIKLLEKWNRVHNLTAVREPEQMVVLHLLDSLSVLSHLEGRKNLLDVGTGAGLPGIPLAIARPDLEITLLDSNHKKTTFLAQAKAELSLANIRIETGRVESYRPNRPFEVVVSRAFSELSDFVTQARHLVAPDGVMLAMKGVYPFDEISRVPSTHVVSKVEELHVPLLDAKRHLVTLKAA